MWKRKRLIHVCVGRVRETLMALWPEIGCFRGGHISGESLVENSKLKTVQSLHLISNAAIR